MPVKKIGKELTDSGFFLDKIMNKAYAEVVAFLGHKAVNPSGIFLDKSHSGRFF